MERMRGRNIAFEMNHTSEESRKALLHQLKGMIDELRALKPSPSQAAGVRSCVNGPLRDSRLPRGRQQFGPFKTIQDFHFWLRDDLKLSYIEEKLNDADYWRDIKEMAVRQEGDWPPTVFTHCDLNPFNILARDGKITGVIDWEFAGWYPDYWEYTSAWYGNRIRPSPRPVLEALSRRAEDGDHKTAVVWRCLITVYKTPLQTTMGFLRLSALRATKRRSTGAAT